LRLLGSDWDAAAPRVTLSPLGDERHYAPALLFLQKQKAADAACLLGCMEWKGFDFMLRLADLAATYSPAS
jgi:hypothetical protein